MIRSLSLCGLTVGWLLLSGCSKSEPSVSGMVRLDGQPLLSGDIRFVPRDETPGGDPGAVIEDGEYRVDKGLTTGTYLVEIRGTKTTDKLVRNPYSPAEFVKARVAIVPKEYNETSNLVRKIEPGSNTINFDLKSDGSSK